jgi:hypothetical protein
MMHEVSTSAPKRLTYFQHRAPTWWFLRCGDRLNTPGSGGAFSSWRGWEPWASTSCGQKCRKNVEGRCLAMKAGNEQGVIKEWGINHQRFDSNKWWIVRPGGSANSKLIQPSNGLARYICICIYVYIHVNVRFVDEVPSTNISTSLIRCYQPISLWLSTSWFSPKESTIDGSIPLKIYAK